MNDSRVGSTVGRFANKTSQVVVVVNRTSFMIQVGDSFDHAVHWNQVCFVSFSHKPQFQQDAEATQLLVLRLQ